MNATTAITIHRTSEGARLSVLYSTIDDKGNVTATNRQMSMIAVDEALLAHIAAIEQFVKDRINE